MTDVRLHSAYQKRISLAVLQKHVRDGVQLNRIAYWGARSVTLEVGCLIGIQVSRKGVSLADYGLLSNSAGLRDAAGLSVCVRSSASNNTSNWVAVADGIGEPLQVQRPDTLGPAIAISRCVKRMAC